MIVYTQPKCHNCGKLKTELTANNIPYEECSDLDIMRAKGFKSTPMLELDNGEVLSYYPAQKWIEKKRKEINE